MTTMPDPELRQTLTGILPPVCMPFDTRGALVAEAIGEQIDFIVESGVHGIVAGGSTGEGHTLTDAEFRRAMEAAHEAVRGRVPFLAGLIVNSTIQAVERAKMLEGMDVAALQVTPAHYLFKPDAEATVAHFKGIWEATGLPILIYNVIPWNYLSLEMMLRIMAEVPGVIGMKQSGGDLKSVSDLLLNVEPRNLVLTGTDALLYPAFAIGTHGAISALCSAVPGVVVELWNAVKAGDHATGKALHFKLNALWNALRHDNLPACVKYIQHRQGIALHHPRPPMEQVTAAQKRAIDDALAGLVG